MNYLGPDILEIPDLEWNQTVPVYINSSVKTGTVGTAPLYLRDGDVVFFRDNDEELKVLTPEEKKAMEKEANKTKKYDLFLIKFVTGFSRTTYYHKEEALTINAKA